MHSIVEIFCEEIPARMQASGEAQIKQFCEKDNVIVFDDFNVFVTPCRLTIQFNNLWKETKQFTSKTKGPRLEAKKEAIEGFLKKNPHAIQEDGYYWAMHVMGGTPIEDYLPVFIKNLLEGFVWPKDMRWPQSSFSWVRPLRRIYCSYNGIPLSFEVFDIQTCDTVLGHRFLSPSEISIQDYKNDLLKAHVMVSAHERQEKIKKDLDGLTREKDLVLVCDEKLLQEVAGLVEYPFVALGKIADQFMKLPKEVLITSMKFHQKYFPVEHKDGTLAPYFGVVLNCPPTDIMISGYERVLRARLTDAEFFYQNDVAIPLIKNKLDTRVYHEKLGSMQDKVERLIRLVETPYAKRAAELCKADLKTMMVGEFPELQGIMGGVYARAQGEDEKVIDLIQTHYNGNSELALSDKLDALVGFFGVGIEPSGSKDPYALRRAALGILKILQNDDSYPSVRFLLEKAFDGYPKGKLRSDTLERIETFLKERLPLGVDLSKPLKESIGDVEQINEFLKTKQGQELIGLYKRVIGLIKHQIENIVPCNEEPEDELEKAVYLDLLQKPELHNLYKGSVETMISRYKIFTEDEFETKRRISLLKSYYNYIVSVIHPKIMEQTQNLTIVL